MDEPKTDQNDDSPPQQVANNASEREPNNFLDAMNFYRRTRHTAQQIPVPIDWESGAIGFAAPEVTEAEDDDNEEMEINQFFVVQNEITEPIADEIIGNPRKLYESVKNWPEDAREELQDILRKTIPELVPDEEIVPIDPGEAELAGIWDRIEEREALKVDHSIKKKEFKELVDKRYEGRFKRTIEESRKEIQNILKQHIPTRTENEGIKKLKAMISDQPSKVEDKPAKKEDVVVRAPIEDMGRQEMDLLFDGFTFLGKLFLSSICRKFHDRLASEQFMKQRHLWFANAENNKERYYPVEQCCERCSYREEPVIKVRDDYSLLPVIETILVRTPYLTCLKLTRFALRNGPSAVDQLYQRCPRIQHLDLTECSQLTDTLIYVICKYFQNLKHLVLTATNLTEEQLALAIKGLQHLETLSIASTTITGQHFREISSSLKRLDIRCCPNLLVRNSHNCPFDQLFSDREVPMRLRYLKMDCIAHKKIYYNIGRQFKDSLIWLELGDSEVPFPAYDYLINNTEYEDIRDLSKLKCLKFGKNVFFNHKYCEEMGKNFSEMRYFGAEFDIAKCDQFPMITLRFVAQWSQLERLELIGCQYVSYDWINQSLGLLKNLSYLNLSNCNSIEDPYFAQVIVNLKSLTQLVVDCCPLIGQETIEASARMATALGANKVFVLSAQFCGHHSFYAKRADWMVPNLRVSWSGKFNKYYWHFDGHRVKRGSKAAITPFFHD